MRELKEKAITLIALVVTIIILLILAGVTLNLALGESGIFSRSKEAAEKYQNAENNEIESVDHLNGFMKLLEWDTTKVTPVEDETGLIIPVPKGFYHIGGKADTGFVISDVEGDNLENSKGGNQFVWVPVPKATIDQTISEESKKLELGEFNSTTTPMAELENSNYRGIIYDYTVLTDTSKEVGIIKYSSEGRREPDILTDSGYDSKSSNFDIINNILTDEKEKERHTVEKFKTTLQEDYNEMLESVEKYGGFYVARYEMSLSVDKKVQYKKGEMSATANTANSWYGLYAYNKQFAIEKNSTSVKSSMMWGCQYDAMLNWMARCGINISNANYTNETGKIPNTNRTTGTEEEDKLNNIYDLIGNSYEWTLEVLKNSTRTRRGGFFNGNTSPSKRNDTSPTARSEADGARSALYISLK